MPRVVAFLALLLAFPMAAAEPAADPPLLASLEGDGPGWVAFRVLTDGATLVTRHTLNGTRLPYHSGIALFDGELRPRFSFAATGFTGSEGVQVEQHLVDPEMQVGRVEWNGSPTGSDQNFTLWGPGEWVIVWWWWSTADGSWTWTLNGEEGVELINWTQGGEAFLYGAHDFRSELAVHAHALAGARAQFDGTIQKTINGRMFGTYQGSTTGHDLMRVESGGTSIACPCSFVGWEPPDDDVLFRLAGVAAGAGGTDSVILAGVDVTLP